MAILKCKMCGGDMELTTDKTFGTCEYCGSTMTLPKVDDDQRAAAFNRGNHFRRIGEFDKALAVYERIVREDDTDAEAHWCCALCRFGIEYVEDPATYEYLPTCHRVSFDSFLEDVDYLAAVEHSDGITKRQYQRDGAKIAEVQRGILATSQNAEPYDVFICYKESDTNGDRTRDSLLAQDIYYQLTEQGRKVFFARITLEDVAGTQYEPYIFAALNSAKVMIVVGTKAEYLNAVWVKNEWSRFLAMMKKDRHKLLLPCYRDMDPYDMPEALSVLQSYDMGKIGFIQDLTRGIAKVLDADKKPEPVKETVAQSCYEKAEIARKDTILSEGKAKMTGEVISNYESAIKLLETISGWRDADEQIIACQRKIEEIKAKEEAERLEKERKAEIERLEKERKAEIERKEAERIAKRNKKIAIITTSIVCAIIAFIVVLTTVIIPNNKYNNAIALMESGKYNEAMSIFKELGGYKDSTDKIEECGINFYGIEVWNTNVGDTLRFGSYEQDNNISNGKEEIEWIVLSREGTRMLLISKYALDCQPYNTSYTDVTWETCTLRRWLNNEFINAAFSADEKAMIPTITVSSDKNPVYSTNPGNTTRDQVFLLSITEANKYFSSDRARQCEPTDFAVANGAWESDGGNCSWWLRSPGDDQRYAAYVRNVGAVPEYGDYVHDDDAAVRPALWIDLNS